MVIDLENGKQIIVNGDGGIRLAIWAHKGSLGVDLTKKQASQLRSALLSAMIKGDASV